MNYGFIYCMGNPCMPGVYKIGMTERAPSNRCLELSSSTSAPQPFELLFYAEVEFARQVEAEMHSELSRWRVSASREFFSLPLLPILDCFRGYNPDTCVTSLGDEALRTEAVESAFFRSVSDEDRAISLVAWAGACGIRMCREDGIVRLVGNVHSPAFSRCYAACFAMKTVLLQYLPDKIPEKSTDQFLRIVKTSIDEVSE
ncbi:MAG: GIY-YIG nuclease family protein [Halopseudomonas aestusnigri]|nr:GIY-YIG nuclease family protein [Halopseudomonas aestusnigri]